MTAKDGFMVPLADGAEVFCRCKGPEDAPPLCLVSGLGGMASFWDPVLDALAQEFRIILHDHRGTGSSTLSRIRYSIAQMTEDFRQLLDTLGVAEAVVVGHSTGGAIAQTLALQSPARIKGLVLSSSWAGPDAYFETLFGLRLEVLRKIGAAAYEQFGALVLTTPDDVKRNPRLVRVTENDALAKLHDPAIVASRIEALLAHDRRIDLHRIWQPTLITCADDDRVTPPHMSEELVALVRHAELEVFPVGGHFLPQTEPGAYVDTVRPFVRRVWG